MVLWEKPILQPDYEEKREEKSKENPEGKQR